MGVADDLWEAKAVANCIAAAKRTVDGDFLTRKTPLGSLSDNEWGWFVAEILCAWIKTRAEQAVEEGCSPEKLSLRAIGQQDPDAWEQGTLEACLPALGDIVERVGAEKPLGAYNKREIVELLWTAIKLYQAAEAGRDLACKGGVVIQASEYGQEIMAG